MGWAVLYIAFGMVALWLLGEVLLQYKARLRWRLLAFAGFLTVVVGVVLPSILVIVGGAIAFGVGQTYVTLSFRKGYSTGWALGGRPSTSRRRKGAAGADAAPPREAAPEQEPAQEQTMVAAVPGDFTAGDGGQGAADETAVYAPQPLPDDTGTQYGVHSDPADTASGLGTAAFAAESQGGHTDYAPADYDAYGGYEQPAAHAGYAAYGVNDAYGTYQDRPDQAGYPQQQYGYGYGYGDQAQGDQSGQTEPGGQQPAYQGQYDGYDTYTAPYADPASYGSYENYADGYGRQQYQDPYAVDTPPGGVWVPQQRDSTQDGQGGYEQGYGPDGYPYDPSAHRPEPEPGGPYRY
ncbi:hypothetical protein AB0910_27330 [Streptomyces sp. NPDC047002]|uniref:hypothetical protein n=1 Tax=Streptomyces sp. NPDC047002 TaxID=3155475 RepID=UPI0034530D3D